MAKGIRVDGDRLRREREARALTQEELSEKSGLGVRTLRRMEAGSASKDSLKRVTRALELEPEIFLKSSAEVGEAQEYLNFDLLTVEFSTEMIPLAEELVERIRSVRRHIARELGLVTPGVRFRDNLNLATGHYRILVRELPFASGVVRLGGFLAVGPLNRLKSLPGEVTRDPTYGLTAKWVESKRPLEGVMYFDEASVLATHLTRVIRTEAYRLLGIEEVHQMLEALNRPHLVGEVVPNLVSLAKLRALLQALLKENVSIRDLALILETIADRAPEDRSFSALLCAVRVALKRVICAELVDAENRLEAVVLNTEHLTPQISEKLETALREMMEQDQQAILVVPPALRPVLRFPHTAVLSTEEVPPEVTLVPWKTLDTSDT